MSVPTETKPPSFVRRSLICSQRPSSSCSSKRARAGLRTALGDHLRAHQRLPPGSDDVGVRRSRRQRGLGNAMQLLVFGIAHDQAVFGVPQHEGLGDGFDRVAQADIGGLGALDEPHLLGDVDRDADEVRRRRVSRSTSSARTRSQTQRPSA